MFKRPSASTVRSLSAAAFVVAALIAGGPAHAALTAPANGASVRGSAVLIAENTGGRDDCVFGNSGDDTRILIDGVVRFAKGDGGSYAVNWNTLNPATTNGSHTIQSQGRNITNGFFSCNTGSYYNISTITVVVANRSFLTISAPATVYADETLAVSSTLSLEPGAVSGLAGRTVTFCISGGPCVATATNSGGFAGATLPASGGAGGRTITATYGGDAFFLASNASVGTTILHRPTALTNLGDTTVFHGETATLQARLVDVRAGAPLGGAPVQFQLMDGATPVQTLGATTDGSGVASASLSALEDAGSYSVLATYAGTTVHAASSDQDAFTITPRPTAFSYSGDTDGYWNETATVRGVLTDVRAGTPLEGHAISFTLGTATATATTDADGLAEATIPLTQAPTTTSAAGTFPGTVNFVTSTGDDGFEILRRPTTLTTDGATSGARGSTVTLSATLTDDRLGGTGVAGKTVAFTLGSASGTAVTDAQGTATLDVPLDQDPDGTYTVDVEFAQDDHYLASSDSDAFAMGWEHLFTSQADAGSISLNTSTREFRVTTPGGSSSIKHDGDMKIVSLPSGVVLPCDLNAPEGCIPPPPPAPCDVNTPEGCVPPVPPTPCEVPDGCVPDVPECVDDPAGGDPICPLDYVPAATLLGVTTQTTGVCVVNPIDGTPLCADDPTPDDLDQACADGTTGCSERFVLIAFSDEELALAGVFDLESGVFVAATRAGETTTLLASSQQTPPPAPCDVNTPEGCVPPVPPVPPVPSCVDHPVGGDPICQP